MASRSWAGQKVEGYLLAAGMCGQGFMLGPGVAELLPGWWKDFARQSSHLEILEPSFRLTGLFQGQETLK